MRLLVTSMPGAGHVHPIVPVAQAVQRRGHEVRWALPAEGVARVEGYGFPAVAAGGMPAPSGGVPGAASLSTVPPRERRAVIFGKRFGAAARRMRPDLAAIVDELRPDLILHDVAELAAPAVAAARGIPKVTVAFSGPLSAPLLEGVVESVADIWRDERAGAPPPDAGLYRGLYLHRFPPRLGPRPEAASVRSVRPVVFDGALSAPPEWIARLGRDRPAVYVTLGTVVSAAAQWAELMEALGSLDVDAIATTGMQVAPEEIGPLPANVRVERYVPQSLLLDRVAVVVSHAGAGTMLAAVDRGVPQVCIPMGADMWENADAVSGAGAGLTLEEGDRDAAAIHSALLRVLDEPAFRVAAGAVAREIAELPHPDFVMAEFEQLALSR